MNSQASEEGAKAILLQELNKRRKSERRVPLSDYPEAGCTSCGEIPESGVPLFQSRVSYIRTCQNCVLKHYPFDRLRLPAGEIITWYRNNPTFHRMSDYGIALTDQALYLYKLFWSFSRWRRVPLVEVRDASFRDSRLFPALHIKTGNGTIILRTPLDDADEMQFDRQNLSEAAEQVRAAATSNGV